MSRGVHRKDGAEMVVDEVISLDSQASSKQATHLPETCKKQPARYERKN
jgi:transaldolase